MSSLKLLIYGIVSQQSALLALFGHHAAWQRALLFITGHLIASILFSLLLTATFPKRFITTRTGLQAFFFCFMFFIPVFGVAGALMTLIYFRMHEEGGERAEFFSVPLPPFMLESSGMPAGMGEGGAWTRLRTVELPRSQRLKALLAVGNNGGSNASSFLQLATGDSDDEIRLLAFNLCERQEQKVQTAISSALEGLRLAADPHEKARFCRILAFSYWEMVYNALSQNDLRIFFVEQAEKYLKLACTFGGNDPALATLMGRIHLQRHERERAEQSIKEALALGASPGKVLPYLAEIAFLKRDFHSLRQLLAQDATLRFKPGIGPVAQFWKG